MLGNLFCYLGIHRFENKPSQAGQVKDTGMRLEYLPTMGVLRRNPWCIQTGIKKCTRPNCSTEASVYREGRINLLNKSNWKNFKNTAEIEYIISLPAIAD